MNNKILLTTLLILTINGIALGQINFREGWEKANPVPSDALLSLEEKIIVHQEFLEEAIRGGDPLQQLYAYLYLVYDCFQDQDYPKAAEFLYEAERIADQAVAPGWQGWVRHRKAIIALRLNKTEEANELYKEAARLCGQAGDSLCLAESLEQVSLTYGKLDDFKNAERYHLLAVPLIEKYGGAVQLGATLNNYGNILSWRDKEAEAIPFHERSIAIYQELGKVKEQTKAMNNLAHALRVVGQYDRAQEILQNCIEINKKNNFLESLRTNYANMSVLYDSLRDYRMTNQYLNKYYTLNDSLIGVKTQQKIAELELKYETQQKELALEKSKLALQTAQRKLEQRTTMVLFILLLAGLALWRWRIQTRQAKIELENNRQNLKELTRILLDKNKQLAELKDKNGRIHSGNNLNTSPEDFQENVFAQNILTEADWTSFKIYFEKVHPGYLQQLRNNYPALTDAEERLFLFIKLQLKTKETANILGISTDSVKKTRSRLRKKLALTQEIRLEKFIHQF